MVRQLPQRGEDIDLAVSLPTDIVMDVARAADPGAVSAARERLAAMATGNVAPTEFAAGSSGVGVGTSVTHDGRAPFERFEAFVLQSFVENMLPDNVESVYGGGFAGGVWKSMMAEQLANQMARAGGIGIADGILKDYYARGEDKVALSGVASGSEKREAETRNLTSQAILHEIQRRVGGALGGGDGLLTERNQG